MKHYGSAHFRSRQPPFRIFTSLAKWPFGRQASPLTFRMRFVSNCIGLRDFTLEAFYTKKNKLSASKHPTTLILLLWKNKYTFSFSEPKDANMTSILRSFDYTKVRRLVTEGQSVAVNQQKPAVVWYFGGKPNHVEGEVHRRVQSGENGEDFERQKPDSVQSHEEEQSHDLQNRLIVDLLNGE